VLTLNIDIQEKSWRALKLRVKVEPAFRVSGGGDVDSKMDDLKVDQNHEL